MKSRITLLQPAYTVDAMGSTVTAWLETRTVHAERVKAGGGLSDENAERFAARTAQFNIRSAHTVEAKWRVQEAGGCLYEVTSVVPNIDRGFKTLTCERVNE